MTFEGALFAELEKLAYDYEHEAGTYEDYHRHNRNTTPPKWRTALPVGAGVGAGIGAILGSKGKRLKAAGAGALAGTVGGAWYKLLRHMTIADSKRVMSMSKRERRALLKSRAHRNDRNSKETVDSIRHQQLLNALERR